MFHYILRTFILKRKEIPAKLPLGPPPWPPPFIAVPFYELTDTLDPPFFSGKLLDSIISIFLYIVFIIQYTLHSSDTCLSGVTSLNLLLLHSIYKLYTLSKIGNSRNTWPYVLLLLIYYNYYYI